MGANRIRLGESSLRVIVAIGAFMELGDEPSYGDIARATDRSLSRVRAIVADLLKREPLLIEKVEGDVTRFRLTEEGQRIYRSLKKAILGADALERPFNPRELVKMFENMIYSESRRKKVLGSVEVYIDAVVPALNLRELAERLKREIGPSVLYGESMELATSAQLASASGIGNVGFGELVKHVINVPIRVARVTDVSLPPHILGGIVPLERAHGALRSVAVWPERARARDVVSYAEEADALGLVKVVKGGEAGVYLQPRLKTGIDVVDRLSTIGFEVLVSNPTRAWIPVLSVYGDVATKFPTVEEVLNGETPMLEILRDVVGPARQERWVKHMLGIEKSMKIPALTTTAPFKTLGVISVVDVGGERRLLALTAARRILGRALPGEEHINVKHVYEAAENKVKRILEESGAYANILKEFIKEGFVGRVKALEIARRYVDDNPERILRDLESLGFIHSVGIGYYSAWTITPMHYEGDETLRTVLAWLSLELRGLGGKIYEDVVRRLVEKGEVNLAELEPRRLGILVRAVRGLSALERMGLVKFINDETIRVTSATARRLLTIAYIEWRLGVGVSPVTPHEERKKPDLGGVLAGELD